MNIDNYALHQAKRNIAQGALTNSKHWERFVNGVYPSHIINGFGCELRGKEGSKWVDFICGLGTNLFGYGNQKIRDYVISHAFGGECHSLPTYFELDAAERVRQIWPFIEKVKFLNDGSSACTAACIIARAFTGKEDIVSSGYHGWHPEFVSLTPPANGVPFCENIATMVYDFEKYLEPKCTAAIIIEPVELDDSQERIEWLKRLRDWCTKNNVLLIFDEIITGVRYPKYSVASKHQVIPDLILLSKAIANGEKISIVGGKKDVMDNDYFVSGTFHGHVPSLLALDRTLYLAKHDNRYDVDYLCDESKIFCEKLNEITNPYFWIEGWGSRGAFKGDRVAIAVFWQEMCKAGYLFGPSLFTNWDLLDHFADVLKIAENIKNKGFDKIKLEGKLPTSPFSSKSRK